MQTNKWNGVNPHAGETPLEKAARHKAKRAAAKARGIKKNGNTKRKTRAARNANDKIRREQAEAAVKKLEEGAQAPEGEHPALNCDSPDRSPLAAIPKRLVWPAAAASEPAPPPAPVAAPRAPSPIDEYKAQERTSTASPEPVEHGSDEDGFSPSLSDYASASPVGSPSP